MRRLILRLWRDESGATAVEYGLMLAMLAVFILIAITSVGSLLKAKFLQLGAKMT